MRWDEETQEAVLRSAPFDFDEEGSKHALIRNGRLGQEYCRAK